MKKLIAFSSTFLLFTFFSIVSCTSKANLGSVRWLNNAEGTGASHPDTLLVKYVARDCTYAPITIMLVNDSTGGSHPDTTIIDKVVLKSAGK